MDGNRVLLGVHGVGGTDEGGKAPGGSWRAELSVGRFDDWCDGEYYSVYDWASGERDAWSGTGMN